MVTDAVVHRADEVRRLGEFTTYREAEQMVDRLSDAGIPVQRVRIRGVGLYGAEPVTGRRAGLLGAVLGAWLGVLAGLLLALFLAAVGWLAALAGGLLAGAAAGAGIGLLAYSGPAGRRDLAGTARPRAQRYAVEVTGDSGAEAVRALDQG